jgi:hypothetical protein
VARQLADLASSIRDLAGTYGLAALAKAAGAAAERLRGTRSAEEAREALRGLRAAPFPARPRIRRRPFPTRTRRRRRVTTTWSPIETLLYGPEAALREALALRARIEALIGGRAEPIAGRRWTSCSG